MVDDRLHMDLFPAQDSVEDGGLGNLIKLPLLEHMRSGKMSCFVDAEFNE